MKKLLFALLVVLPCVGVANAADPGGPATEPGGQAAAPAEITSILFIGNSFVFVNDLPGMLTGIAAAFGTKIETGSAVPGGYTFQQHAADAGTRKKIAERRWTYVVLQEQSQRPDWPERQLEDMVYPPAKTLVALARTNKSKPVFYETWGLKNGDGFNCKYIPETCTYEGMQRRITGTYRELARSNSALLVPVGEAWARVRAEHLEIELYQSDSKHPSREGTYLAACVFYSKLFHRGVLGADAQGLPAKEAEILQRIAQETVFRKAAPQAPRTSPSTTPPAGTGTITIFN
jgi:hypothetical protein